MKRTVTIRKARLSDLEAILAMWRRLMAHHRGFSGFRISPLRKNARELVSSFFRRCMRGRRHIFLVAEEDGRLVGYNLNTIWKNIPVFTHERCGMIMDLFVEKSRRGRGIASAFRREALNWFRKKGATRVVINANFENARSRRIYRRWGMVENNVQMIGRL
jgi:GNAT superfamily N-acetyltransferase